MICAECGMPCDDGEYHPFAACLMYRGCHDAAMVRVNLGAVLAHAMEPIPATIIAFEIDDDLIELDDVTNILKH